MMLEASSYGFNIFLGSRSFPKAVRLAFVPEDYYKTKVPKRSPSFYILDRNVVIANLISTINTILLT